ncbi:MAG TPA: hypothetical protein VGN14_07675, partial [Candidatus Elarobacter sp.]
FGTPGGPGFAAALAARVVPLLEETVLGGIRGERVVSLTEAPRFDAARAAGCFGAAPAREALTRLAPYAYALRFVRGRTVAIDAADAVGGWAVLRAVAAAGVAPGRIDAASAGWYGAPPAADLHAEVAIIDQAGHAGGAATVLRLDTEAGIPVVDPLPYDVALTFDPAEGSVRRRFTISGAPEPALGTPPAEAFAAVGGSEGRIAVVVGRPNARDRRAADTDEAEALVAALGGEGFTAALAEPDGVAGADLVHLIGTRDGRRARAVVDLARRSGIPVAVHAYEERAEHGGWWGATVARYCFEYGSDEGELATFLGMLVARQVTAGPVRADAPYAPPDAALDDAAAALRDADVVFAATEGEADAIRTRSGRRGPVTVVPPLAPGVAAAPVGALVGAEPFALVHGPIGPVYNQLLVARAAALAGIPLVVCGPVDDASYLERIREFGGRRLIVLAGEPEAGVAAGLRAAATVVVDAAWVGDGGARLAAAAIGGAQLAVGSRRPFPAVAPDEHRFDEGDITGLTRALGQAWDAALRGGRRIVPETLAALAPAAAVRAIVRGYAGIGSPVR